MSQTPPPPDPQWAPPPQQQPQPQWTPPPQQPMGGWGGPGYAGPPPRPAGVTLAAIYLIVMGLIVAGILGGCGLILGSALFAGASQAGEGGAGSIALGVGLVPLIVGILGVVGGAGVLAGAGWGRWISIAVAVVSLLFFGLLALLSFTNRDLTGLGITFAIPAVLYALSAVALLMAGSYFSRR